jgi:hypothetical protein
MTNLARHLRHLSSEKLCFDDFKGYILDYLAQPEAYGIADMPEYLQALHEAKGDLNAAYAQYEMAFVPTHIPSDLNAYHSDLCRMMEELRKLESLALPTQIKDTLATIAAHLSDADYELTMVIGALS